MGLIIVGFRITTREAEVKEDWKTQHVEQQNEIRRGPLSDWGFGAGDLVKTGQKIVKVSSFSQQTFSYLNEWLAGSMVSTTDLSSSRGLRAESFFWAMQLTPQVRYVVLSSISMALIDIIVPSIWDKVPIKRSKTFTI
jgi:hypothetical protein